MFSTNRIELKILQNFFCRERFQKATSRARLHSPLSFERIPLNHHAQNIRSGKYIDESFQSVQSFFAVNVHE